MLFILIHKVVLTFESVDEILMCHHSSEATEQYFPVVLFIVVLHALDQISEFEDEILMCGVQINATEQHFMVTN